MISHSEAIKKLLTNVKTYFKLATKFHIKIRILMVISFFWGCTIALSVSNAEQHEDSQNLFNVEAFDQQMIFEADEVSIDANGNFVGTGNVQIYTLVAGENQTKREADKITYNTSTGNIIATGNVEISHGSYTLKAGKAQFNRENSILFAEENVELVEPDGNIVTADRLELSEDFKDGFIFSLQIETIQRVLFCGKKGERIDGTKTTIIDGVYTPYLHQVEDEKIKRYSCKDEDKAPLWRIRAQEIIFDHVADTITFKNSRIELFGIPVTPYFPYREKLKPCVSGILGPSFISDTKLGYGFALPYHICVQSNRDLTVSAAPLTNQGVLLRGDYRHRLRKGTFSLRGSGIQQLNPSVFQDDEGIQEVGNRRYRGAINFNGNFRINRRWSWGWDLNAYSDKKFVPDYGATTLAGFGSQQNIRLNGHSGRNTFEAHLYRFEVFGNHSIDDDSDPNKKQPRVHPLIDYQYFLKNSVLGGELSFGSNVISVSREKSDFFSHGDEKFFRGIEGGFSRSTIYMNWRRNTFHPLGHVLTPFLNLQGDLFVLRELDRDATNLTSDNLVVRGMPTIGLEYRFPLIDNYFWGSQIIEPIGQVIIRPDEQRIGELPNEDAQSLVFDASTLFEANKFSGFDRTEGGIRANLGIQQLLQFNNGGSVNTLIGQSYNLFGINSYEESDIVNSSRDSGLQSSLSDYIGSIYLDTNIGLRIGTNARLDYNELNISRLEVETAGLLGPISASLNYAFLEARPEQGIVEDRQEILSALNIRLFDKFRVFGSVRYDLNPEHRNFIKDVVGFGYDDEGFSFSLTFSEDRSRLEGTAENRRLLFRFGLRTITDTGFSLAFDPEPN